jgi:hypothetical protein
MTSPKPLYFATDADIYDLLEPEVKRFNKKCLLELALRRGIILSPSDERVEIIQFISMLPFSQVQLQELCEQIESSGRAQRTSSIRVNSAIADDLVTDTIFGLKHSRSQKDEQWSTVKIDEHYEITVEYTEFNHRKSSLRQRSVNQVTIQVEPTVEGELTIRHTANTKGQEIAKDFLLKLSNDTEDPIPTTPISLAGIADRRVRTSFWVMLIKETDGLAPVSVTKAGVSRDMTSSLVADTSCDGDDASDDDSDNPDATLATGLIRKAVFEGDEVLESAEYQSTQSSFFVYKASWQAVASSGDLYEIEAEFRNPAAAHHFEYIFRSVLRKKESGGYYKTPRRPLPAELRQLSQMLEDSAHAIVTKLFEDEAIPVPPLMEVAAKEL